MDRQYLWKAAIGGELGKVHTIEALRCKRFVQQGLRVFDSILPVLVLAEKALSRGGQRAVSGELPRDKTRAYRLTEAEHATMCLLCRGLTNQEIGVALGISTNTVGNRIAACYSKLDVTRRAEAVFMLTDSSDAG